MASRGVKLFTFQHVSLNIRSGAAAFAGSSPAGFVIGARYISRLADNGAPYSSLLPRKRRRSRLELQRRSLHPLLLWGSAGKIFVKYSAWLAGRLAVDYLSKEQAALQLSGGRQNSEFIVYLQVLLRNLFSRTTATAFSIGTGLSLAIYIGNVEDTPITKRQRLMLLKHRTVELLSEEASKDIRTKSAARLLSPSDPRHARVSRVCQRLVSGARTMPDLAEAELALGLRWTVTVIDEDVANVFVLPNGDVYVYTGFLDALRRRDAADDTLAAVLGHEMAHALLRHSAEQLSLRPLTYALEFALLSLAWSVVPVGVEFWPGFPRQLSSASETAVAALTELPHSRLCELEADSVGLRIAAAACYDPRRAVRFWAHACADDAAAAGDGDGAAVAALLSTHPASAERERNMQALLPAAERQRALSPLCGPAGVGPAARFWHAARIWWAGGGVTRTRSDPGSPG